jgi:ADP-ribose pyrophosphatase YjhB (NUDIX family)
LLTARITDKDIIDGEEDYLDEVTRYGARGILLDNNLNIAMMFMSKNGYYKLPGGGIEAGETPDLAFLREVKEETGYNSVILEKLGYIEEHKKQNEFMQTSYCFIARKTSNNQQASFTDNELALGFSLTWMTYHKALEVMAKSFECCIDYTMRFMLLRDKLILENAGEVLGTIPKITL